MRLFGPLPCEATIHCPSGETRGTCSSDVPRVNDTAGCVGIRRSKRQMLEWATLREYNIRSPRSETLQLRAATLSATLVRTTLRGSFELEGVNLRISVASFRSLSR